MDFFENIKQLIPIVSVCVIVLITVALIIKGGPGSAFAELVFMSMHEFRKGTFASIDEIRRESPVRNPEKVQAALDFLLEKGRVIRREVSEGVYEYRIHDNHWKDPHIPTQQFN